MRRPDRATRYALAAIAAAALILIVFVLARAA